MLPDQSQLRRKGKASELARQCSVYLLLVFWDLLFKSLTFHRLFHWWKTSAPCWQFLHSSFKAKLPFPGVGSTRRVMPVEMSGESYCFGRPDLHYDFMDNSVNASGNQLYGPCYWSAPWWNCILSFQTRRNGLLKSSACADFVFLWQFLWPVLDD